MRKFLLILAAVGAFCGTCSWAAGSDDAPACPTDPSDPFSYQARMPGGPLQGRCINTAHYRSVRSLTDAERAEFGVSDSADVMSLANFRHLNRFWVAQIDLSSIDHVEFQLVALFGPLPVYHTQLRFVMKPGATPVRLVSQKSDPAARQPLELRGSDGVPQDFVVALFGVRDAAHDADAFNPLDGLGDINLSQYAISYAFQSLYDGSEGDLENHQRVQQYRLDLSAADRAGILRQALGIGTERKMTVMYDILTNNCINFVFEVLSLAMPERGRQAGLHALPESLEPLREMRRFGIVDPKAPEVDLATQYPHGIEKIGAP